MRHLMHLVRAEWRNARALTIASALVAIGASVAIDALFFHGKDGGLLATWVVPALLGLFLAATASDLVAGDVASRRIDSLALLPARLRTIWASKALFLAATGAKGVYDVPA